MVNNNDVNPLIADELSKKLTEHIINGSSLINDIFNQEEIEKLGNYQCDYFKYLISKEAKGITGQSINLCAGLSVGY